MLTVEYSKIASVEVINFMVYKHAKIQFDDTNIINMKGYNSSGKSTMLKAIGVCLMNMFAHNQAKLIRHGEDYFRIIVNFDDGVSIVRDKYINGQSLYEVYRNGERIFTTREGNRLTRVDEVPQLIQNYLGLCMLSTGCLNYQSRQDRLWLIETKGSENYQSLNEILKTEEISRASALINSDKNKLNSEITQLEAALQQVNLDLEDSAGLTEDLLSALENRQIRVKKLLSRYSELSGILKTYASLESLIDLPEVKKIDISRYTMVDSMKSSAESLLELKERPNISKIEVTRLSSTNSLVDECSRLNSLTGLKQPAVDAIKFDSQTELEGIVQILQKLNSVVEVEDRIDSAINETNSKLSKAVEVARRHGRQYVKCDTCGSYMEVANIV